jgi:membrane protein implicated in regulation of membrane protease activity
MGSFSNILWGLGSWNWLIAAAVLFILEVSAPGMHIIWFALAAAVVGLLALVIPMSWQVQVLLFLVLAIVSVLLARKWMRSDGGASDQPNLNVRAAQYIGQTYEVVEAISGGQGRIRVGDTLWQAVGPDAPAGSRVKVVGADGILLKVVAT